MRAAAAMLLLPLLCGPAAAQSRTQAGTPGVLDFSPAEQAQIASHGPWPQPRIGDASNRWQEQPSVIEYGRRLFFDRGLSQQGQQGQQGRQGRLACADCHDPRRAFQDGRPVAEGRAAGVRNTPTLLDVAERRWFGWGGAHDSLWAASFAPLVDPREMGSRVETLAAQVRGEPARRRAHQAAFGTVPAADDRALVVQLAKALAAYQATLRSPRTSFDRFRDALARGDERAAARYPLEAQRGLRLFIGEARCSVCHAGPAFTNDEFADIGVPFFVAGGVDGGRHRGLTTLLASPLNRLGAFNDAGAAADTRALLTRHLKVEPRHFGEFRVPGLRQLTRTAPYMHDGSLATLADVVRHYDRLNEERLHADGERILRPLNLTAQQAQDLQAFLRTLSD
jgi:cytochrome c peroxidase